MNIKGERKNFGRDSWVLTQVEDSSATTKFTMVCNSITGITVNKSSLGYLTIYGISLLKIFFFCCCRLWKWNYSLFYLFNWWLSHWDLSSDWINQTILSSRQNPMDNLKRITGWKLRLLSIVAITTPHITVSQLPDITTGLPITLRGLRTIGQHNSRQPAIITIRIKNYNKLLFSIDDNFLINE